MIAKYIFVALCAALALQIQCTLAAKKVESGDDLYKLLSFGIQTDEKLSPHAEITVNTILKHLKFVLINKNSSQFIRLLSTNIRKVLTNEVGAKNVKMIVATIGYFLRNEQSAAIIAMICDEIVALVINDGVFPQVLASFSAQFKNVLAEPKALVTTKAFIEGMNVLLDGTTPAQITNAIRQLKNIVNIMRLAFVKGASSTPKTPTALKNSPPSGQLTKSNSMNGATAEAPIQAREISSADEYPMTVEEILKLISQNESNINIDMVSQT